MLWARRRSPWRYRVDAMLFAFAVHAAAEGGTVPDLLSAFVSSAADEE